MTTTALGGAARPLDELIDLVGDADFVLLGEASHGTHEFYELRSELTRRLIAERDFRGVGVEADWPAAYRVNRYVQGKGGDTDALQALGDFERFPRWMWRNRVIADLVEWMRGSGHGAGFYGLDLYSLRESMSAVIDYLDDVDPAAAERARQRYACFGSYDEQGYGRATVYRDKEPCEDAVLTQLRELLERASAVITRGDPADAQFAAEQNAKLAANAERYYRTMFRGGASSWNLRDTHMSDTLDALHRHLGGGRIVVWAHNSHLGDARATAMSAQHGQLNLGQLTRQRHAGRVCIVGFTTHTGTVTAARDWDQPPQRFDVAPSMPGSLERRLHEAGIDGAVLDLRGGLLGDTLLQRMIGVVYRPETERWSHYVEARASEQYDLLVHLDQTRALEPLDAAPEISESPAADTFPSGL